jgi:hypothetical protein
MNNLYLVTKHIQTDDSGYWYCITDSNKNFLETKVIPRCERWIYTNEYPSSDEFDVCFDVNWNLENGSVSNLTFDVEKAKNIFVQRLRKTRESLFTTLDVEFMKALEIGNQAEIQNITNKKEKLRNITDIDLSTVTNIDELKSKWPTNLLGNSPYQNI